MRYDCLSPTDKHLKVIADAWSAKGLIANKANQIVGNLKRSIASRSNEVIIIFSLVMIRLPPSETTSTFGMQRRCGETGEIYKCGLELRVHDLQKQICKKQFKLWILKGSSVCIHEIVPAQNWKVEFWSTNLSLGSCDWYRLQKQSESEWCKSERCKLDLPVRKLVTHCACACRLRLGKLAD